MVLWLLVMQRLDGGASLSTAVLQLLQGLPASFWPDPCKRIQDWRRKGALPSSHTGAYNQARQALPLSIVQQSYDHIFDQLVSQLDPSDRAGSRTFILDGSTVRTAHSKTLCEMYPPASNQHGEGHWPMLRIVVAHDLSTGLAMRPEWGPMYGPQAVSEQGLLESAMDRLPSGSTVMGDSNFGVFSVAYAAVRAGHAVVLRLSSVRAKRLAGEELRDGIDRSMLWKPSKADRKSHPHLPADAMVSGRLIVRQVQPDNGGEPFLLAIFTTLQSGQQEHLELYTKRWNIETDLRTLKSSLKLDQLTAKTPDMVAKEIDMGWTAYNLVRAMICLASQQSGMPPRGYSFTKVRNILETFLPQLHHADEQEAQRIFKQMMKFIQQSKLYPRKRKRPAYPRKVWPKGAKFPNRKA